VPIKTDRAVRTILHRIVGALVLILSFRGASFGQASAMIKFGNSYVNLSKKTVGGPVQPGDTLEIRVNFYVNKSYNGTGNMYKVRYYDSLPTNTSILAGSTLNLISNEGVVCRAYTQASDADAGTYVASPGYAGGYQIRINMGTGAAAPAGVAFMSTINTTGAGTVTGGTTKPLFSSGSIISTAFRVVVTGGYGDTITLGGGKICYRQTATGVVDTVLTATKYQILIQQPSVLCANSSSTNFAAESGGTFGSGVGLNRSTGPTFPIPNYTYLPNSSSAVTINDGYYAIVNNTSPTSSTYPFANRQPTCGTATGIYACSNREFGGFWFIGGDHTGTTTAAGNPPPSATTSAGYMLVVNADLATSEAYHQVISGLCPNTYYQFSCWVKNICPNCGIDTNSVAEYTPGVLPNLSLVVDGIDRMSTGQLDTVGWQQRGFVFLTDSTETSITISIRNNAPGGGGNDWALDDITLATCPPNITLTPNKPDTLCQGADDTVRFAVSSYVNNYSQFELQQSTDGGVTWTLCPNDTLGHAATGTMVPVYNPALMMYVDTVIRYYRVQAVTSTTIYRLTIASTTANLANASCNFTTSQPKLVFGVNCMVTLPTTLISFRGQLNNGLGQLVWTTAGEIPGLSYSVERSDDGVHFSSIAVLPATAAIGEGAIYQYTDPNPVNAQSYYRINMLAQSMNKFSQLVLLSNGQLAFQVRSTLNPFTDHLGVDLVSPGDGVATLTLLDLYGRVVHRDRQPVTQGYNALAVYGVSNLPAATYALLIQYNNQVTCQKVVKVNTP
jgi:hypothetical protein